MHMLSNEHPPREPMHTLSILIRNSCVHWAYTHQELIHTLSMHARNLCICWAYTSLSHACTEHAHQEACPLLSYSASFWAMQHPTQLHYVLLKQAALFWAMHRTPWWATLRWATPPPHNATYWTMLHHSERRSTFLEISHLTEPQGTLLSYAAPNWFTLHPLNWAAPFWATVHPVEVRGTPYELAHPNYKLPFWFLEKCGYLFCTERNKRYSQI